MTDRKYLDMTDRELLELAAKAAGIILRPVQINNVTEQGDDRFIGYMTDCEQWARVWFNPLTNDADALRLAVKLRLVCGFVEPNCWAELPGQFPSYEACEPDPYAATRRAIVRAAAEIGRNMKEHEMNKLKTSEMTGTALDWAVAKCEGVVYHGPAWTKYSTDWSQGGPIIEREGINVCIQRDEPHYKISPHRRWYAQMDGRVWTRYGPTPLIAAMRCYVMSRFGDEIEIPQELFE